MRCSWSIASAELTRVLPTTWSFWSSPPPQPASPSSSARTAATAAGRSRPAREMSVQAAAVNRGRDMDVALGSGVALAAIEGSDVLDDAARECLGCEPDAFEDRIPLGMVEKLLGNSVLAEGGLHPLVVEQLQQGGAAATDPAVVFNADHQSMVTRQVHHSGIPGLHPPGIDDCHADALVGQTLGHLDADGGHRADAE